MKTFVPDASVILKWAIEDGEADREAALALQEAAISRVRLLVPALWRYEVGNILARRLPGQAAQWLLLCEHSGLQEAPVTPECTDLAFQLCQRHGVTFYDACYHALALTLNAVFVTADAKYVSKAAKSGHVTVLKDLKL